MDKLVEVIEVLDKTFDDIRTEARERACNSESGEFILSGTKGQLDRLKKEFEGVVGKGWGGGLHTIKESNGLKYTLRCKDRLADIFKDIIGEACSIENYDQPNDVWVKEAVEKCKEIAIGFARYMVENKDHCDIRDEGWDKLFEQFIEGNYETR